jgi:two-component system, LytTR family, sensor kinase
MCRITTILLFILLASFNTFSQQKSIDSLNNIINSDVHDTIRLATINALLEYLPQNECEFYNNKMIAIAESKKDETNASVEKTCLMYAAEGYYNKGVFLSNKSEVDSALMAYKKSIDIYTKLEKEESIAYPKMSMAIIYTTKGDFYTALNLLYSALKINEKYDNKEAVADCNIHLGRLHYNQKMYEKALAYTTTAYNIYREIDYKAGIIDALHKLSAIATDLKKSTESIYYLKKNVDLINSLEEEEKQKYLQTLYSDKATIAFKQDDWDSSIYFNKKSIELSKQSNNLYLLGTRYLNIAEAYSSKKEYKTALEYANKTFNLSIKDNNIALKLVAANFLSSVYKYTHNYKQAYEMQSLYLVLNDSIQKVENKKNIVEAQLKYEYEKKELKNASIQEEKTREQAIKNWKKNMWIAALLCLFLITAITTYFIIKNQQQKNIIQKQQTNFHKQKAMLAQMNPHFIFNAINSIQNFVLNNKEDEAYNYLTKFSKLIRMILHNSNEELLALSAEIEALNLYISLEQLRFSNSFNYKLSIADNIDEDNVEIPTMLIQPYVENAIWHGLMNLKEERKAVLLLDISIENNLLKIIVEDNGIGRVRSNEYKKETMHNPVAMKLTAERLDMMKQSKNATEISVTIIDLHNQEKEPCGTRVELFLPLIS